MNTDTINWEKLFDRLIYHESLILKSYVSDVYSHKYMKIKVDAYDDSPLEKALHMRK